MKTYSILNEATGDRVVGDTHDDGTPIADGLGRARRAAKLQAGAIGYDHSVWESTDDGETWTNTGDYYTGEHGSELV